MPWIQAELSILQGEEHTVGTMRKLHKLLRQAQQSRSRPLIFHCHRATSVVTYSDVAWAVRRKRESQAGYRTCLADAEYLTSQGGRCRRSARNFLSTEVQAAGEAQEEGEYVRLVIVDLLFQDANKWSANEQIPLLPRALVLDCEALYDGVSRSDSSALGWADKRSTLEAMALKISLSSTGTHLHWVHSEAQLADVMTKSSGPSRNIFAEFMKRDRWRIIFHPQMRSARKRKIEGLNLVENHSDENLNEDERHTSAHQQPTLVSLTREAKSRHFKKSLTIQKPTELVSVKGGVCIFECLSGIRCTYVAKFLCQCCSMFFLVCLLCTRGVLMSRLFPLCTHEVHMSLLFPARCSIVSLVCFLKMQGRCFASSTHELLHMMSGTK